MIAFATIAFAGARVRRRALPHGSGLSVTMGLMGSPTWRTRRSRCSAVTLAVTLMNAHGWPFLATLPVAFVVTATAATLLERLIFRRLYARRSSNR